AGLRPAQRRDQRHGQDQQRQQRAQACDQQLAAGAEREHDLVGPREQPRHQVLQALYRCEHGRPLGGAAYRAGMGASSERRPALQARAARSAVGRGYVPDALFPRTTRSAIVGLRPDTLVAPRRTIAVGRGYAPDVLFAATYGVGLVYLPFRRNQDQELSRRDGASHLSLLVQRNLAQRKHTPPARPVRCTGFAEPAGFSEEASCLRGKRRASMRGALRVWSAGSAASEGPRRSRSRSTATATAKGICAGWP